MNGKEILDVISDNPYTMYGALMSSIASQEAKLTPQEKAERNERRRIREEQRVKRAKVINGICPVCDEGKLIRGKKEKKAGYKRLWTCGSCEVRVMDDGNAFVD
ncbi:hypothetical protein [Bacillus sp. UMB0728]|uniref:hypothetical protein n=1 Tax=Bacillus sp. UMB0728 TaxID=2066052 RepID=UPI000C7730F8|nr:hypothetical protein [Bacillus sp. UMB0728]PLR72245.1 hypothetical protein CYJ37_11865 [Bacillus sp. UMB0728]